MWRSECPTVSKTDQRRVDMLNSLFKHRCTQSRRLHYVKTELSTTDLSKDGVHLTTGGKTKLAKVILAATRDFIMTKVRQNG